MSGLVVYGSLINKLEIERKNIKLEEVFPVSVKGFKRVFSQEPSWRRSSGNDRAVLTVVEDEYNSINAILILGLNNDALHLFDERERGYWRKKVNLKNVNYCPKTGNDIVINDVYIYVGKQEKYNENLMPNPDYLRICIDGAKMWSEEFYEEFLKTTFVGGRRLSEVIE